MFAVLGPSFAVANTFPFAILAQSVSDSKRAATSGTLFNPLGPLCSLTRKCGVQLTPRF